MVRINKLFFCLLVAAVVFNYIDRPSYAGEIDILLQKLVDKGILSPGEAQEIKTETQEQVKKEIAQGKYSNLPEWIQKMKFKGDFRLRYQYDHEKNIGTNASKTDRNRGRFRLRLGLEAKPNDKILAAVGIASGKTGDPRSTNQTFQDAFDKKPIILDYAYAQYSPKPWVTLIGGKMKNPLWEPGDLIWDTDITPEGGSVNFSKKLNSKTALFLNTGVFVIDENNSGSGDDDDP
ncbi:MAG: putative porin, partial [Candidatus Omnitrophica bacterium]|nr:putative porin [Candidatus Omnitrophota bacterium]